MAGGTITATVTAFVLTGATSASYTYHTLPAGTGSFTETGIASHADRGIRADTGSFIETGRAATLSKAGSRTLGATTGVFSETGNAATLTKSSTVTVTCGVGVFTLVGATSTSYFGYGLPATTGLFVETGIAASLHYSSQKSLTAGTGVFTETGSVASLLTGGNFAVIGSAGAFTLTLPTVSSYTYHKLPATGAAFVETGRAATLTKTGTATLAAGLGTFTFTGRSAVSRREGPSDLRAFTFTFNDAILQKTGDQRLQAAKGSFTETGSAAFLQRSIRSITAAGRAFSVVGRDAVLWRTSGYKLFRASTGVFTETGGIARLKHTTIFHTTTGAFVLSRESVQLDYTGQIFIGEHAKWRLYSLAFHTPVYWTDCDIDIDWNGQTWAAKSILPGQVNIQPNGSTASFQIADADHTLFLALTANSGEYAVASIYEAGFFAGNMTPVPDRVVQVFSGRVDRISFDSANTDLCEITMMPPVSSTTAMLPERLISTLVRAS